MLFEDVKSRLSIAFVSTADSISICRNIVTGSSLSSTNKSKILEDLADIENILMQQKFEDVNAIEEAIIALEYTSAENLPGGERIKESLGYVLQWLEYIKKTLGYEGLVASGMEDIRSGGHTIRGASDSQSNYGYFDDSGTFISAGSMEGNPTVLDYSHF